MKKKLLFITRSYPPTIGGLEQYCYDFHQEIKKYTKVTLLKRKEKESTLLFLLRAGWYGARHGRKYTHIHLGDGLLVLLARWIKLFSKAKLSVSVHGLEILHIVPCYQSLIKWNFKKINTTICVSENTQQEARKRNAKKTVVIPNAIRKEKKETISKQALEKKYGFKLKKNLLFSIGRQVKRKGTAWFVEHVMSQLPNHQYLIAGAGEEIPRIKKIIKRKQLNNVHLLGKIDEKEKNTLFSLAQWFIMPNITVPNDAEGFGITIIEAGMQGCGVLASAVDGIPSAVVQGKTGFLVPEQDAKAFIQHIRTSKLSKRQVKKTVQEHYSWNTTGSQYAKALQLR